MLSWVMNMLNVNLQMDSHGAIICKIGFLTMAKLRFLQNQLLVHINLHKVKCLSLEIAQQD